MKAMIATLLIISSGLALARPNPATVNCKNKGGESLEVISRDGSYSLCTFGKGQIEEWTLYSHGKGNKKQTAITLFFISKVLARTAEGKCTSLGGKVITDKLRSGSDIKLCQFKDKSLIELNTLFKGSTSTSNKELVKALE
jgi:putative hemolysin